MRNLLLYLVLLTTASASAQSGLDLAIDSSYYVVPDHAIMSRRFASPQYYMARVINQGDVDAIDFTVSCTVQTSWEDQLFTAQQVVEFLAAGDTTLIYFNEEPFDYTNSAATAIGIDNVAEIIYEVEVLADDTNPANNQQRASWLQAYNYVAKERGRTLSLPLSGAGRHTIGNVFYFSGMNGSGGHSGEYHYIAFSIENVADWFLQSGNGHVIILMYEFDGDENGDGILEPSEYDFFPVYFNEYLFEGDETSEFIHVPIHLDEFPSVNYEAGKYYLLCLQFKVQEDAVIELGASDTIDYAATLHIGQEIGIPQYTAAYSFLPEGEKLDPPIFTLNAFGTDTVPLIRLSNPIIIDTNEPLIEQVSMEFWPSPAHEVLRVRIEREERSGGTLEIRDVAGALLQEVQLEEVLEQEIQLDTSNLPAGSYVLRLSTNNGTRYSKVFVVQH